MTEAFRRDNRMNTFAIHHFIDAFPSGWMKAIMDVERRPKLSYFAYREALTPLMVNLRGDRRAYFGGETAALEAWVCNDTHERPEKTRLAYRLELNGQALAGGRSEVDLPACSSACQGMLRFALPDVIERSCATVRLALLGADDEVLHDTALELQLFPRPAEVPATGPIAVLGAPDGKAATLVRDLGLEAETRVASKASAKKILVDDMARLAEQADALQAAVQQGATVVILEMPAGEHAILKDRIDCKDCGMNPVQFVSRATGHPLVAEFAPEDFMLWYNASLGYPSPLLERTFTADGWAPILTSGNGPWNGDWAPVLAAAEKRDGKGAWRICNLKLAGRIQGNPVAELFARKLICS